MDGTRVFIGSFHFDPRSAEINTELGFVIDSTVLAQEIENAFDSTISANADEVRLSDDGQLYWIEQRQGEVVRYVLSLAAILGACRPAVYDVLAIEWLL